MYNKFLVITACLFAFNSCSKVVSPNRTATKAPIEDSSAKTETTPVDITELSANESAPENRDWNQIVDSAELSKEYRDIDDLYNEYMATSDDLLKGSNSMHVSMAKDYNPLADRNYMYFNLKNLENDFHYPVDGKFISNYGIRHGRTHSGVDLKAPKGYNVYAVFDGVVRMSKYYSAYGYLIVVRHYNGLETVYAHNSKNIANVGDIVQKGDVIAKVGRTGRATTEHVHFEVRIAGQHVNPNALLDVHNNTIQKGDMYVYKRGSKIYASNTRPSFVPSSESSTTVKPDKKDVTSTKKDASTTKKETTKSNEAVYHTIVRGNTLGAIARRYGTTVSKICSLNKELKPTTTLQLNRKIRVK